MCNSTLINVWFEDVCEDAMYVPPLSCPLIGFLPATAKNKYYYYYYYLLPLKSC